MGNPYQAGSAFSPEPSDETTLSISWKVVATAAMLLALTGVASTAVVATVRGADTLATIALALAVIAFVVQIIVFTVQTAASSRQQLHSQQLYGSTMNALATIEEKAEGTRMVVSTMSDKLLDAAFAKAIPQASEQGIGVDSPEFSRIVAQWVNQLQPRNMSDPYSIGSPVRHVQIKPPDSNSEIGSRVFQFPGVNAKAAIEDLENLSDRALRGIRWLADDYVRASAGNRRGIVQLAGDDELHKSGLVKRRHVPWSEYPVFQLTERGRRAVSTICAEDVPMEFRERVSKIQERIRKEEARLKALVERKKMESTVPIEDE